VTAFDHWHKGYRRLRLMERWLIQHGGDLPPDDWADRVIRRQEHSEEVSKRYSDWMLAAIKVAELYERMKAHMDRERVERDYRLDFLTPKTNESSIRRQWRLYLADDYTPPPF
jgi:hypothetical protein